MRAYLLLTVSLTVLLSALAQKPHPCKAPPYLQGKLVVLYPEGKTVVYEQFYYDAFEQRIRLIAAGKESTHDVFVDRLLFFRERFYYEISYHNKTCTKVPLTAEFIPIEIPFDAHHKAQYVLGSLSAPAQGLLVNEWVGSTAEANYTMSFTEFGCIPITTLYSIEKTGHILSSFFDMVIGLDNPDILIPPSFCTSAKEVELKDGEVKNFFKALI
ncbi:hypothetical protein NFI96_017906 [Prochilodus magdalenae]|nr:hypothetical protein NFI96_017906 [Prochilodus magdalenae]